MKVKNTYTEIKNKDIDLDISKITLLSLSEYNIFKDNIIRIKDIWWLRSPGSLVKNVACIDDGSMINDTALRRHGVRPALVSSTPIDTKVGNKFEIAGFTWTMISEYLILCDDIIAVRKFDDINCNDYETSEVKKWLESWWSKQYAEGLMNDLIAEIKKASYSLKSIDSILYGEKDKVINLNVLFEILKYYKIIKGDK